MSAREKILEWLRATGVYEWMGAAEAEGEADNILALLLEEVAREIEAKEWDECCGSGCSDLPGDVADWLDARARRIRRQDAWPKRDAGEE